MPGFVATVILLLEISPDGSVMSAQVVRSNANDAANAAAIQYAHATRWMPGKIGGEPRAMQASLTVILGERS
jgi:TonB family protein